MLLKYFVSCFRVVVQLLGLNLWEPSCDPKTELSDKLLRKLQSEIASWIDTRLEHVMDLKQDVKDEAVVAIEKIIGNACWSNN